jgi:hypothetical protein
MLRFPLSREKSVTFYYLCLLTNRTKKTLYMETQTASVKKTAYNFGIILALASILLQVISYVTNTHLDQPFWLKASGFLLTVAIIVYAIKTFKTSNSGFLSLSEALKVGLAVSVISAIIYAIYFYLFCTAIEPNYIADIMDLENSKMIENNPNMTNEEIEGAAKIQAMFAKPMIMASFVIIGSLFFGFIISLIAGLVMKNNRPE